MGITGMQSQAFEYFMECLCRGQKVSLMDCFAHSECLSADVTNGIRSHLCRCLRQAQ